MNRLPIPPYAEDEVCPPSDKYGTRQIALQSYLGTLYASHNELIDLVRSQAKEIEGLRSMLMETLELIDGTMHSK